MQKTVQEPTIQELKGMIANQIDTLNATREKLKQAVLRELYELVGARKLTGREREVYELVRRGKSNKEIAVALNFSERTAKFHVSAIFDKMGVSCRNELLALSSC